MYGPLVQCVPNFSEGRNQDVLSEIAVTIRQSGATLVDWSSDIDHNRSVFTIVGPPAAVKLAAFASAEKAVERIDLKRHSGEHPRLGSIDVLPFVPLREVTLEECSSIARESGMELAEKLHLPVFFYDKASDNELSLPSIRKNAFVTCWPDLGPLERHPSAGAVAVGAREPLIAFNIVINSSSLAQAKEIARDIRKDYTGKVRSLGLLLPSRELAQVSLNIVRTTEVSLYELVAYVKHRVEIVDCELIGAMPGYSALSVLKDSLMLNSLKPGQVLLESWYGF